MFSRRYSLTDTENLSDLTIEGIIDYKAIDYIPGFQNKTLGIHWYFRQDAILTPKSPYRTGSVGFYKIDEFLKQLGFWTIAGTADDICKFDVGSEIKAMLRFVSNNHELPVLMPVTGSRFSITDRNSHETLMYGFEAACDNKGKVIEYPPMNIYYGQLTPFSQRFIELSHAADAWHVGIGAEISVLPAIANPIYSHYLAVFGPLPEDVLGRTQVVPRPDRMSNYTIMMNGSIPWSNPAERAHDFHHFDFETVLTHEIGHALGLGHIDDPESIMYPNIGYGEVKSLSRRDIECGRALISGRMG